MPVLKSVARINLVALALSFIATLILPCSTSAEPLPNPFFAMDTGTKDATHTTIESQVQLIKQIGFDGFGPTYSDPATLRETLAQLDKAKLKLFALYIGLNIDSGKDAVNQQLKDAINSLQGRDTFLWVYVQSTNATPSSKKGDALAVEALQELSAAAAKSNLRIALYPHTGFFVEKVDDAVRLARKVNRPNLGVTFNLCHWLQVDGKDLDATLELARPYLFVATINGADKNAKGWDRLIQPLGSGTYDVETVLRGLAKIGFTGPIGLQHYGIQGSAEENLKRSMQAWKKLSNNL